MLILHEPTPFHGDTNPLYPIEDSTEDWKMKGEETVDHRIGRTHITETNEGYTISIKLPGIKGKDIRIQQNDDSLELSAKRKSGGDKIFSQSISIDKLAMDSSNIDVQFIGDCLMVTIPLYQH
jgi:HSP20 family molecular chaperone IbpA